MISNSVTSEKHRRASGGQPRLSLGRVSISRQVAPICREDEDENDVEAVPPTPPPQPKVMKPTRRRSSINRTRETIVRLLRDQDNQKPLDARKTIADSLLSPLDWLTILEITAFPPMKPYRSCGNKSKNALTNRVRGIYAYPIPSSD